MTCTGLVCMKISRLKFTRTFALLALAVADASPCVTSARAEMNPIAAEAIALRAKWQELYRAGKYGPAIATLQRLIAVSEQVLGPNDPSIAGALSNMGALCREQGRYVEAEPLLKRSVAILEKARGPNHVDVATALGNLAGLDVLRGRYADAEAVGKRALAIYEKALGAQHPNVGTMLDL